MKNIIIPSCRSDQLPQQLVAFYNCLKDIDPGEKVNFTLDAVDWVCPLIILPLSAYIYNTRSTFSFGNCPAKSYLETIGFGAGIDSVTSFQHQIQEYKNFIPISVLKKENKEKREQLEALFLDMIYKILGHTDGTRNAIYYPVGELVSNIFDHSKNSEGFVFGQLYPSKNFLDMCIVDCGRGLARAYKEESGLTLTDEEAINKALEGFSTKPDKERGWGIRSSVRVVCEALQGGFLLLSGNSAFISVGHTKNVVNLPNFYWQGVIIAYRVPKPTHSVDIMPYIA